MSERYHSQKLISFNRVGNVSRTRAARLACVLVCLLGLAWPCLVSAADPKPVASKSPAAKVSATNPIDDRYRQVEKMSELERDRLQRNIADFRQLTPEQQTHYRELHQKLEEDKAGGGKLSNLLSEYTAWLTTLTPSQRDELSQELEPAKKVVLVTRFKREQDARYESSPAETPTAPADDSRPFPKRGMSPGPSFAPPELSAVMKVIANDAGVERDKSKNEPLHSYYREVLQTSIRQAPGGPREWPDPKLMQKIELAIERSEQRDLLRRNPDFKRQTLIQLIVFGMSNQVFQEARAKLPTPADLLEVFKSLDQPDREKLNRLPKPMQDFELERRYFADRKDDPRRGVREMQEQIDRLLNELGVARPQRPPGGGGFGSGPFARDRMPDGPDGGRPNDRPRNGNGPDKPRRPGNE